MMDMDTRSEGLQTPPHTGTTPTRFCNQELEQQIAELAAQINVANYRLLTLIARLENKRADAVTLLAESYLQSAPTSLRRSDASANGAPQHSPRYAAIITAKCMKKASA